MTTMIVPTYRYLTRELITGFPAVDDQHEALFAGLVKMKQVYAECACLPAAEADHYLALMREHYRIEEALAASAGVDFTAHARQHELVLRAVTKTMHEVVQGRASVPGLLRYLEYWFERHIAHEDLDLAESARKAL